MNQPKNIEEKSLGRASFFIVALPILLSSI